MKRCLKFRSDEYIYQKVYIKNDKFYTFLMDKTIDEKVIL